MQHKRKREKENIIVKKCEDTIASNDSYNTRHTHRGNDNYFEYICENQHYWNDYIFEEHSIAVDRLTDDWTMHRTDPP